MFPTDADRAKRCFTALTAPNRNDFIIQYHDTWPEAGARSAASGLFAVHKQCSRSGYRPEYARTTVVMRAYFGRDTSVPRPWHAARAVPLPHEKPHKSFIPRLLCKMPQPHLAFMPKTGNFAVNVIFPKGNDKRRTMRTNFLKGFMGTLFLLMGITALADTPQRRWTATEYRTYSV